MPRMCAVVDCDTTPKKYPSASMHKLPTEEKYKQWKNALVIKLARADTSFNPSKAWICSRHFEEDCFRYGEKNRRNLIPNSLPTLHMPQRSHESPKLPTRKPQIYKSSLPEIEKVCYYNLQDVHRDAENLKPPWLHLDSSDEYVKVGYYKDKQIQHHVTIDTDLNTHIQMYNFSISKTDNIEKVKLHTYLNDLLKVRVCPGIYDSTLQKFSRLPDERSYFTHATYERHDNEHVTCNTTVRSKKCVFLLTGNQTKCMHCNQTFRALKLKHTRRESKTIPTDLLNKPKKILIHKITKLRQNRRKLILQLRKYRRALAQRELQTETEDHQTLDEDTAAEDPIEYKGLWTYECMLP